MQQRSNNNS